MSGNWVGSTRAFTLPKNWQSIRQQVLERDMYRCQQILESTDEQCGAPANQADHIDRFGSQTDMSNLQALCSWCHARKSAAEGQAAQPKRETSARPKPLHPGSICQ